MQTITAGDQRLHCLDCDQDVDLSKDASNHKTHVFAESWACFVNWKPDGKSYCIPVYVIHGKHHLKNQAVDANTLIRLGFKVPATPPCPF